MKGEGIALLFSFFYSFSLSFRATTKTIAQGNASLYLVLCPFFRTFASRTTRTNKII